MKLRSKKTGEIGELKTENYEFDGFWVRVGDSYPDYKDMNYYSLAELNADWEDAPEEPKKFWYITGDGEIAHGTAITEPNCRCNKSIGNYFATKEEAERAVRKLKAWQRLKEKGFRFDGYDVAHKSNGDLAGQIFYDAGNYFIEEVEKEMNLLFGDEE